MTCDCISYNRPEPYQKTPNVGMKPPQWAIDGGVKDLILVDACIADQIQSLWDEGIWTDSSCCGHNGEAWRSIIVSKQDAQRARDLLREKFERPAMIAYWSLVVA